MGRSIIIDVEGQWDFLNNSLISEQSIVDHSILKKFKTHFWLAVGTIWEDAKQIGV